MAIRTRSMMFLGSMTLLGCVATSPLHTSSSAPAATPSPTAASPSEPRAPSLAPNAGTTTTLAWDSPYLLDVTVGADGRTYALAFDGVYRLSPDGRGAERLVQAGNEFSMPGIDPSRAISYPVAIGAAQDGTLLVAAIGRLYLVRPDGRLEVVELPRPGDSIGAIVGDRAGNIYVASRFNTLIHRREPAGAWRVFAGRDAQDLPHPAPPSEVFADGQGTAARFGGVIDLAIDRLGRVLVADHGNGAVRRITPEGEVTTLWGPTRTYTDAPSPPPEERPLPTPTPQIVPGPGLPRAIAVAADDTVYVACTDNRIRRVAADGTATVVAGDGSYCQHLACMATCPTPEPWSCYADGPGPQARFDEVEAMGVGPDGAVYVLDGGPTTELKRLRLLR